MMPWEGERLWSASADGGTAGGGAADLQTDVMRFMAMLALCLVAIFALVQSLPLTPVDARTGEQVEPKIAAPAPPVPVAPGAPVMTSDPVVVVNDDTPSVRGVVAVSVSSPLEEPPRVEQATVAKQVPDLTPAVTAQTRIVRAPPSLAPGPREARVPQAQAPPLVPDPPGAPPEESGFTLRFQSDAALLKLVGEQQVKLYALDSIDSLVLRRRAAGLVFERTAPPRELHEMETDSVPELVRMRYARASGRSAESVSTFGVVLPASMRRQIDGLVSGRRGGELRIADDGSVSLH